jgi:hypothetical protein
MPPSRPSYMQVSMTLYCQRGQAAIPRCRIIGWLGILIKGKMHRGDRTWRRIGLQHSFLLALERLSRRKRTEPCLRSATPSLGSPDIHVPSLDESRHSIKDTGADADGCSTKQDSGNVRRQCRHCITIWARSMALLVPFLFGAMGWVIVQPDSIIKP